MRAERAFHNRYEFDLAMRDIHEWPARRERSPPPEGPVAAAGPERVHSAAKGISIRPLAGADPLMARSMSIRARSATGTCRWPG
jgi:hypothetical protein